MDKPNKRTHPKEYECWKGLRKRCRNKNCADYKNYGGRGISVCARWDSFELFLLDMGIKPNHFSIERIDNAKNYEPSNCRWASRAEQNLNKRNIQMIEINGLKMPMRVFEKQLGFSNRRIDDRMRKGWSLERAISTPQRKSPS